MHTSRSHRKPRRRGAVFSHGGGTFMDPQRPFARLRPAPGCPTLPSRRHTVTHGELRSTQTYRPVFQSLSGPRSTRVFAGSTLDLQPMCTHCCPPDRVDPFLRQCRAHEGQVLFQVALDIIEAQIAGGTVPTTKLSKVVPGPPSWPLGSFRAHGLRVTGVTAVPAKTCRAQFLKTCFIGPR